MFSLIYSKQWNNTEELESYILNKHDLKEIASSLARNYGTEEGFRIAFARVLFRAGCHIEAVKNLLKAIKINPDSTNFLLRGTCYYVLREFENALNDLSKAIKLDQN